LPSQSRPALDAAIGRIRESVEGAVLTGADEIAAYARDRSAYDPGPTTFAVVIADSVADVRAVARACTEFAVPLVARGAGSGYAGGATASPGAIVLSLERLDAITEIDVESQTCVVGAGVITADVSRAVLAHGLRYAPDPASASISTIGGNIATGAGGLCCVKYGVTRESVLGLDVVLADGRLVSTGHRSVKGVAGYDLTALVIGSEGTLGIVVGATLRLLPLPPGRPVTIAAFFASAEAAVRASVALGSTRLRPSMLEFVDEVHLGRIDAWRGTHLLDQGQALLLVQTDGLEAAREADVLAAALAAAGGTVELTADPGRADELLAIRRWTSQEAVPIPEVTLNEDIAVPRSKLVEMIARIREIRTRHDVVITVLAHLGDGNLHANIRVPLTDLDGDGSVPSRAADAAAALVTAALDLGGTITGEHGIGVLKRQWLRQELGDEQYALQQGLKRYFDPLGILNPGKVFPSGP
jgi:glycolate oxidase